MTEQQKRILLDDIEHIKTYLNSLSSNDTSLLNTRKISQARIALRIREKHIENGSFPNLNNSQPWMPLTDEKIKALLANQ
ncbi:hypothetical protein [Burkholderia multivorans]|uniref:hypothetical protein n=1 Tax=Burkholderia multivorans TaxID=87883 RepID=UPI0011B2937B|nr:hypothetical protein [Burkholderia multivorans]